MTWEPFLCFIVLCGLFLLFSSIFLSFFNMVFLLISTAGDAGVLRLYFFTITLYPL